jgi:hypothetical protein
MQWHKYLPEIALSRMLSVEGKYLNQARIARSVFAGPPPYHKRDLKSASMTFKLHHLFEEAGKRRCRADMTFIML